MNLLDTHFHMHVIAFFIPTNPKTDKFLSVVEIFIFNPFFSCLKRNNFSQNRMISNLQVLKVIGHEFIPNLVIFFVALHSQSTLEKTW